MQKQQTFSLKVSPTLSLVSLLLSTGVAEAKPVQVPTNHIIAIDCSGSMYGELNKIRTQLKNKLPTLVKEGDTVSIIAFSSRGQCVLIVEGLEIRSAQGLANLQAAVDRYLKTMGLTGFVDPLLKAQSVIESVTANTGIKTHSLLFLTDGHDNQWSVPEIIAAVKPLGKSLASATFVEYGYYCNRALLTKMAEECGGRNIFSEDFADYEPQFEQFVTSKLSGKPKIQVALPSKAKYDMAFTVDSEGIVAYAVELDGSVLLDPEITQVFYHSETAVGENVALSDTNGLILYASLYVLSQRMKSNDVYDTLAFLGDVEFIDGFTNAYGKQKLYAFQNMCLEVVLGQRKPLAKGYAEGYLPDPNAFCLMDLFELLTDQEGNSFVSEHHIFNYNRIGAKKVAAASKEEIALQDELGLATENYNVVLAGATTGNRKLVTEALNKVTEITKRLQEAQEANPELVFEKIPNPDGTPISSLIWNEDRPNLSVLTRQRGNIALPANEFKLDSIESFRYRAFTIVKDGIVNVKLMPVKLGKETFAEILAKAPNVIYSKQEGTLVHEAESARSSAFNADDVYILDLTALPIVNRAMVQDVSAKELFQLQYNMTMTQGEQSVFNHFQKLHFPKVSKGFADTYGAEAADWLKGLGITDYNGFNPRVTDDKIGETYMSTELVVKLEGLTSKPTVKSVWDKMTSGKGLTEREKVFETGLSLYRDFTESSVYKDADDKLKEILLKTWIESKQKSVVGKVRGYLNQIARIKFSVILGQVWFKEFTDVEDNTLTMTFDGKEVVCKAILQDKEVSI